VPDGLFGIEYSSGEKKAYRFFAVEADRGTMPISRSNGSQTSYLGKLTAYREILAHRVHKTHWGIPNLLVLTVTIGARRIQETMDRLQDRPIESAGFLFKALAFPDLLTTPKRAMSLKSPEGRAETLQST